MRHTSVALLVALAAAAACGALVHPKRATPPDSWSLKAAALHSMMTVSPAFSDAAKPDCSAAPMPDLQLFCEKKCDAIGELSLKAYCAWECDDIKNPDLGVMCKLEVKHYKQGTVRTADCDAIDAAAMKDHCQAWIASLPQAKKK